MLNSLNSPVDLLPSFVGAASSPNDTLEWKCTCFYKKRAWMEFHNKSGSKFGGGTLHIKPPKIKAFTDKVIQCPLQDIAMPLSGFHWEYSKGNFHHWRPLFLHFDTYFKTYLSSRNDLLLSDKILEDDSPFPKHAILHIL